MSDHFIPPAGLSAASFYVPTAVVDPARPPGILCDNIDPATGELRSLFASPHPVDGAVQHAFSLRYGSGAATEETGHKFREILYVDETTERQVRDEVKRLLKPFVDAGDIRIDSITVAAGLEGVGASDTAGLVVNYTNLQIGKPSKLVVS